jgi:hypothetical protein
MEPFIRNDQYNFIKEQAAHLVNGHSSVNDKGVLNALRAITSEKAKALFPELTAEQEELLAPLPDIKDRAEADRFLEGLQDYIIPFPAVSEQAARKLFPKAKKLKVPEAGLEEQKGISYFSWDDKGTGRRYMAVLNKNKLAGLSGTFKPISQKGICSICGKHGEAGLFVSQKKGAVQGTYVRKGNYICRDTMKCNQNLTSLEKLEQFVELVK